MIQIFKIMYEKVGLYQLAIISAMQPQNKTIFIFGSRLWYTFVISVI